MGESAGVSSATETAVTVQTNCRLCRSSRLQAVWNFGATPLANAYLSADQLGQPELFAPLEVNYCADCHLVQLKHIVAPEVLFSNYLYVSSTSPSFVAHFDRYASDVTQRFGLTSTDLVVDVGSNDGVLLKPFQQRGVRVLGIDPAENIAAATTAAGLETIPAFFTPETARRVAATHGHASVITANNVFAHTDGVASFVEAVKELLTPDGVFIFEVQYLGDLLAKNIFDIVYHEHLLYYHLTPLVQFMRSQGMEVFDVQRPPVHGGSLRVFVQRAGGPHPREATVDALLAAEEAQGLNTTTPYTQFADRIAENSRSLKAMLTKLKREGKRIVGYGAPAKATTLLYALGVGSDLLDYIVDDDRLYKQRRFMPGSHIPIVAPERLYED